MINSVVLTGRPTEDPDMRYTKDGEAVTNLVLAVQRNWRDKKTGQYEADFIKCTLFGATAEVVADNVRKGQLIGITGQIRTGSYDKEDGSRVWTTEVNCNSFQFLEKRQEEAREEKNYKKTKKT